MSTEENFQIPYVHIYAIQDTPKRVKNCIVRQMFKRWRRNLLKEWAYAIHDKDHVRKQEFDAYVNKHNEDNVERWGQNLCAYQGVIKKSLNADVETVKWFNLPPQFIEIRVEETRSRLRTVFNARNREATSVR